MIARSDSEQVILVSTTIGTIDSVVFWTLVTASCVVVCLAATVVVVCLVVLAPSVVPLNGIGVGPTAVVVWLGVLAPSVVPLNGIGVGPTAVVDCDSGKVVGELGRAHRDAFDETQPTQATTPAELALAQISPQTDFKQPEAHALLMALLARHI